MDDPHILECAVIITDKHLNELERGHWIVHHESSDLEALSDFHKTTYKSIADGMIHIHILIFLFQPTLYLFVDL